MLCEGQDTYIQEGRRDMEADLPMTRLQRLSPEQCKQLWKGSWESLGQ